MKDLIITIDQIQRDEQVREVVESDFFDNLKQKGRKLRQQEEAEGDPGKSE